MFLVISDKDQFSLIQTHWGLIVVGDQGPRVCLRLEWDIRAALGLSEELAFLCEHFLMLVLTCVCVLMAHEAQSAGPRLSGDKELPQGRD